MTVRYRTTKLLFHSFTFSPIPLSLTGVVVGFNSSNFDAIEGQPAEVCMEVFIGELGTSVAFSISITEVTGTGADTKKLLHTTSMLHVADHFSLIAASDLDTTGGPFILQLLAGSEVSCIQIPIVEDALPEGEELFIITAQTFDPRIMLFVGSATVTIEDNDDGKRSTDLLLLVWFFF